MARWGNKIPTDSLAFFLDASVPESYSGSGNTWYDLSGNNYHATLVNSPTYNNYSYARKSITFNGSNQYGDMSSSYSGLMNLGSNWTIVGFYKTLSINNATHTLWSNLECYDPTVKGNATLWGFDIGYNMGSFPTILTNPGGNANSLKIQYGYGTFGSPGNMSSDANTLNDTGWKCVASVFRNTSTLDVDMYINNIYVGSQSGSPLAWAPAYGGPGYRNSAGAAIRIASTNAYWPYDLWYKVTYSYIEVNKLVLYKKALNASELKDVYLHFKDRFGV